MDGITRNRMSISLPPQIETDRHVWQAFQYHSRTFSLAARLLPKPARGPIATLYLFCRAVDTIADDRVLEIGPERALDEVYALKDRLDATLAGTPPDAFMWQRLHQIHQRFGLHTPPLYELIDGAVWDLEGRAVESRQDLIDYSNLVGGSIGAMVLPFLLENRADWQRAEPAARTLGIAMQITNITRDVGEDLRRLDRIYLPHTWMAAHGLTPEDLRRPTPPASYPLLMETVMETAEALFLEGMAGIALLPARMKTGIRTAARVYREILNEVRANSYDNLNRRAFVPFRRKCLRVFYDGYARRKKRLRSAPDALPETHLAADFGL